MAPLLRCPVCGSNDLRRVADDAWRCHLCDSLLAAEGDALAVRIRGVPPAAGGKPGRVLGGLALLAALGGGAVWWLVRPDPAADEAPVVDKFAPDIDLRDQLGGVTPDGRPFWLQTYRNLDRVPLERPTVEAKLFDDHGNLIGIHPGSAVESRLPPGEDTVVLVVAPAEPKFHRVEVFSRVPVAAEAPDPLNVQLGTRDIAVEGPLLRGKVRNIADGPVRIDRVAVVGRKQDGTPVAWAEGEVEPVRLEAGDEVPFEAPLGVYQVEVPEVWTGVASGIRVE